MNPDGRTAYRIRIHGQNRRELAVHEELVKCDDESLIFLSTEHLIGQVIERKSENKKQNELLTRWGMLIPLPYTIWALGEYCPSNQNDPVKWVNDSVWFSSFVGIAMDRFSPKLIELLGAKVHVAIVPSHEAGEYNPSLLAIARDLQAHGHIDVSSSLVRYKSVESSRARRQCGVPGNDIDTHLDSIRVVDVTRISRKVILLLDNVVTTGTSFIACRKLLLDAGVAEVVCLALGKNGGRKMQEPSNTGRKHLVIRRSK
ncbi:hypothetical protein W02_34720 [Nitrospira sp. KM1]|nr:hypothetical protein W02_34720 [Nitrospira sp. KM1]